MRCAICVSEISDTFWLNAKDLPSDSLDFGPDVSVKWMNTAGLAVQLEYTFSPVSLLT